MGREDNVQLIQRILSGDDGAFSILVEKYQKSVHALVWRKIGDFHYAEEITQDTFLQVYKKLPTPQKSPLVCRVALCHRESALPELAAKAKTCDAIAGGHTRGRSRKILLYPLSVGASRDRSRGTQA